MKQDVQIGSTKGVMVTYVRDPGHFQVKISVGGGRCVCVCVWGGGGGGGVIGWYENVVYLTSPGCPTDIG